MIFQIERLNYPIMAANKNTKRCKSPFTAFYIFYRRRVRDSPAGIRLLAENPWTLAGQKSN